MMAHVQKALASILIVFPLTMISPVRSGTQHDGIAQHGIGSVPSDSSTTLVVLGVFERGGSEELESQDGLVPVLSYQNGRYEPEFAYYQEGDSTGLAAAERKSILQRTKNFSLYLRGQRIGSYKITRVAQAQLGCVRGIVGFGQTGGVAITDHQKLAALSGSAWTQDFYRASGLTDKQRREIQGLARDLLPKNLGGNQKTLVAGKPEIKEAESVDLDRDGRAELFVRVETPLRYETTHDFDFRGMVFMVLRQGAPRERRLVFSSVGILEMDGKKVQGEVLTFRTAVDLDGDGKAEVLVTSDEYESFDFELYGLRENRLVKLLRVPGWGC